MPALRLVIADDEEDMRAWLALVLAPLRAEIREAASGGELLEVVERQGPLDLIICDVRMPAPDGLAVLAALRGAGSSVPALVISGFADEAVRARATGLGAVVLAKPFTAKQLLAQVRRLLERTAAAGAVPPHGEPR